jgi:hypothetical protein
VTAARGWPRCSYVADAAGDPREGTAPPADRWFLLEHPGPWGRFALTQSGVDPTAVAALAAWAAAEGGRVVLVRRPGRAARSADGARTDTARSADGAPRDTAADRPRRWFRVNSSIGHEGTRTGTFTAEAELVEAVHTPGDPYDGPLTIVCAHGRHDTCCAVRGRPVAAAAATTDPDRTWECSHIGGCRFAPAMVLLPHGYTLGGMPPDEAPAIVRTYRDGRIDPRWLRGRSSLPPAVQAAQHHARLATGELGVDALRPVQVQAQDGPDGTRLWRVELAGPDCSVLLRERREETGRPLTCAASAPGWMRVFDLLELRTAASCR